MSLLAGTDVPSRAGINNAITTEIANHASLTNAAGLHYDSGWVLVPVNAATVQAYPGREPRVRRIGSLVMFLGSYRGPAAGSITGGSGVTVDAGSLPAGFAPPYFVGLTPMAGSNATSGSVRGWIDGAGGVRIGPNVTVPYVAFSTSWFI